MTGANDTGFNGARVAILESRLEAETAAMVRRLGGEPVSAPSLAEVAVDADAGIHDLVDRLSADGDSVVIFQTGVAVARLFDVTDRLELSARLADGLRRSVTVARGPKPSGALGRRGVTPSCIVADPFTTAALIDTLDGIVVDGRTVTLVHYGERSEPLVAYLAGRRARVHELMLYEWRLPADTRPLSRAVDAMIAGEIAVLALTSQIQVRHLLEVAGPARRDALVAAINKHVLVGAVGPTCAAACAAAGLTGVVTPAHPKLAPMLNALVAANTSRRSR